MQAIVVNGFVFYALVAVLLFVDGGTEGTALMNYVKGNPAMKDLENLAYSECK